MTQPDPATHLLSLPTIRRRSSLLLPALHSNTLHHFSVSLPNLHSHVLPAVVQTIQSYVGRAPYSSIPPHGRWQHFGVGGTPRLDNLIEAWDGAGVDRLEKARRVIDLTLVSVLLDAGAGNEWGYVDDEGDGRRYGRSEGLAVASLRMFERGLFASDLGRAACWVDANGLEGLTTATLARGLQVTEENPIAGLEGRAQLLRDLGRALRGSEFFGGEDRPGGMVSYLLPSTTTSNGDGAHPLLEVTNLWAVLTHGLGAIWPARTRINGVNIGDAWHYSGLTSVANELAGTDASDVLPFHKLTQWLTYSLLIPFKRLLHCEVRGEELLTGLPEYRNGGLLVDYGVLTLKEDDRQRGVSAARAQGNDDETVPLFAASDDVVVEWRAATVCLLDMLLPEVNTSLGLEGGDRLTLAQMLEAGSWAAGREVAARKRPKSKGPPIGIVSDGTVF